MGNGLALFVGLVVGILAGAIGSVLLAFPWNAVLILAVALLTGALVVVGGALADRRQRRRLARQAEHLRVWAEAGRRVEGGW
jgi:hypothetical protein